MRTVMVLFLAGVVTFTPCRQILPLTSLPHGLAYCWWSFKRVPRPSVESYTSLTGRRTPATASSSPPHNPPVESHDRGLYGVRYAGVESRIRSFAAAPLR